MSLKGKTILLGITGGIAAYKICELIRLYKKDGANVKVIVTPSALNFITELTLATLTDNPVYKDNFDIKEYKPEHISLADEGDILVIAPISANTISKLANGICDNLLTSITCAFNKPIIIAPAMNTNMWNNPFVQENVQKLSSVSYNIINPESGELACGTSGVGRLCDISNIFDKTVEVLNSKKKLLNKKIVITSGGTLEKIDPVRYISNFSSGKMGTALADVAYNMGAEVTLISTFDANKPYNVKKVQSADEMKKEVEKYNNNSHCIIMAAAVADFKIKEYNSQKIKKTSDNEMTLELVKNPDILQSLSKNSNSTMIIGFCAESENLIENAKNKIQKKNCDYLVANDISRSDIGFSSDENEVYLLDKALNITHFEKASKAIIAKNILEKIFE